MTCACTNAGPICFGVLGRVAQRRRFRGIRAVDLRAKRFGKLRTSFEIEPPGVLTSTGTEIA
jgi:hypothetical protein